MTIAHPVVRPSLEESHPDTLPAWNTPGEWMRLWGYAVVVYTVLVVLATTSSALNALRVGQPIALGALVAHRALEEYTCALFVPPLFWLVHRFPLDRRHWRRSLPVLLGASGTFVVAKYVGVYLPVARLAVPGDHPTLAASLTLYAVEVLSDFWGVIGVAHAIEFYQRAQRRERLAGTLRVQLSEARLHALREQLQPHFLFNALNGVVALMHQDVHAADRMLVNLAALLRASLEHAGAHEIRLADELAVLDRYLTLVGTRFRDRLTVVRRIEADLDDALVPPLLLQPLIENAVEHGVARQSGPVTITLSAARVDDQLVLGVADDGLGLRGAAPRRAGIGLANTRARLDALYGTAYELRLDAGEPNAPGQGVHVTIRLPLAASA